MPGIAINAEARNAFRIGACVRMDASDPMNRPHSDYLAVSGDYRWTLAPLRGRLIFMLVYSLITHDSRPQLPASQAQPPRKCERIDPCKRSPRRISRWHGRSHADLCRAPQSAGAGLDLVVVSPTAVPPVAKAIDYGHYQYEMKKKSARSEKETARGPGEGTEIPSQHRRPRLRLQEKSRNPFPDRKEIASRRWCSSADARSPTPISAGSC